MIWGGIELVKTNKYTVFSPCGIPQIKKRSCGILTIGIMWGTLGGKENKASTFPAEQRNAWLEFCNSKGFWLAKHIPKLLCRNSWCSQWLIIPPDSNFGKFLRQKVYLWGDKNPKLLLGRSAVKGLFRGRKKKPTQINFRKLYSKRFICGVTKTPK